MSALNPTNATSVLGSQELVIPAGLKVETAEQRELYRASLEFERFFVQNLVKQANAATEALGSDDEGGLGSAGTSAYKDMTNDQLVQSMLDGGGLGIASSIYTQMAEAAGIGATPAKPAAPAAPAAPTAPGTPAAPAAPAGSAPAPIAPAAPSAPAPTTVGGVA